MVSNRLSAAAVEIDITPPVGSGFDGYAARVGKSVGIHDLLLGQLLLLKTDDAQAVVVTLDLLGVNLDFTSRVREGIEQAIGVPGECILIACSHTHSGAAGFIPPHPGITTHADPEQQKLVARQVVGAAIWANQMLQPAALSFAHGQLDGIGLNRNNPEQAVDRDVILLRVDTLSGQPIAVLMNYGCHPTVLGYQNLLFSADYPGAARAALHRIYPEVVFLYTNGASGDISTRFTRREQTFKEVDRMGRILAGEVLKLMHTTTAQAPSIDARCVPIEFKFRTFPPVGEAQHEVERLQAELEALKRSGAAAGEIRIATTRVEGASGQALMARDLTGKSGNKSQLQMIEIGDLVLLGVPGEPFTQTVLEIKQGSPQPRTAIVSYANDYQGYFPDSLAIAEGSYEALISPYAADIAERLRNASLDLLHGR